MWPVLTPGIPGLVGLTLSDAALSGVQGGSHYSMTPRLPLCLTATQQQVESGQGNH